LEYRSADQAGYYAEYELKENEDVNDWSKFVAMIDTLNNVPADRVISSLDPILNIDGCLRILAFNMTLSNFDSYTGSSRNYYFYEDSASGKLQMLPWDLNEAFGVYTNGWNVLSQSLTSVINTNHRPLTRVILENDSLRAVYLGYVDQLVGGKANSDSISARADLLHTLVHDHVLADPNKLYSDQAFLNNVESDVFIDIGRRVPGINAFSQSRNLNLALQVSNEFVYPGDTDNNGVVNAQDILPIGVYFHQSGMARQETSFAWEAAPTLLWSAPEASYADANGDGSVDERDAIAIGINWHYTHSSSAQSYEISPDEAQAHRATLEALYALLSGASAPVLEMKALLESILNIASPVPVEFSVSQNYPNPFNGSTRLSFTLPEANKVTVIVTDILGRVVATPLVDVPFTSGAHYLLVDLESSASGIYFLKLQAGPYSATQKLMLLK
jgi:hypothetical protein